MSRKVLDYKTINSPDAIALAKFVYELTLKGYEPYPMQCNRQYGNIVITMALYEEETKNEPTEESTGNKPSIETTDTIGSTSGEGENGDVEKEAKLEGTPSKAGITSSQAGSTGNVSSDTSSQAGAKPKRNTRAKAKVE